MESHIKEALEIVKVQASVRAMNAEEITTMLKRLAEGIRAIKESGVSFSAEEGNLINPQKAIKENSITCVVCGKSFKILTTKHLHPHGHTAESYREFCGYKKGTPLVCKSLQRNRRKKMKAMRLWERRSYLSRST